MKELDSRIRRERERKQRKEKEEKEKEKEKAREALSASKSTPATNHSASQTPVHSGNPWRPNQHHTPTAPRAHQQHQPRPPRSDLPPHPHPHPTHPVNGRAPHIPIQKGPPPSLVKARLSILQPSSSTHSLPPRPSFPASGSSSSTPLPRGRRPWRVGDDDRDAQDSPAHVSRSPSPISRRPGQSGRSGKQREHAAVLEELSKNGYDHVTIDVQLGGAVREDDVRQFFEGFKVDKVSNFHEEVSASVLILLRVFLGSARSQGLVHHFPDS